MLQQVFDPKGLDLRSNDITRDSRNARDMRNIEKNANNEFVKKRGHASVLSEAGIIDLMRYQNNSLYVLKNDSLKVLNGATLDVVSSSGDLTLNFGAKGDFIEYNNVLYWTDPSSNMPLWKFDGYNHFKAGLPQPTASLSSAGAGSYYYRLIYKIIDLQGNIHYSDFQDLGLGGDASTITTLSTLTGGFYNKYATEGTGAQQTMISNGALGPINLVLTVLAGHNYVADNWVLVKDTNNNVLKPAKIASVTATTITFDGPSFDFRFDVFPNQALEDFRTEIVVAVSTESDFGFKTLSIGLQTDHLNRAATPATVAISAPNVATALASANFLRNYYDDTVIRILPPNSKYIALYGDFVVLGNLLDRTIDTDKEGRVEDTIYWSDIPTSDNGSTVETFLVDNRKSIGDSDEGVISGLFGDSDNIIVFKERQVYYLNGELVNNSIRERKALTNRIGCVSSRSIIEIEGGAMYMTQKGLYLAMSGAKPVELSDLIEPLFSQNLVLTGAQSLNDAQNERIYIFIPKATASESLVVVYDYYFKEWYVHNGIIATNGLQLINDTEIYHADDTDLYLWNDTNLDGIAPIDAYYKSGWWHFGAPSVLKKFVNFLIHSLSSLSWTAQIRTYNSFDASTVQSDFTMGITASNKIDDHEINLADEKAVSFEVRNNLDEPFHMTGYEFEYEMTQTKPKGES